MLPLWRDRLQIGAKHQQVPNRIYLRWLRSHTSRVEQLEYSGERFQSVAAVVSPFLLTSCWFFVSCEHCFQMRPVLFKAVLIRNPGI